MSKTPFYLLAFLTGFFLYVMGSTYANAANIEIGTPQYVRTVGDQLYYFPRDESRSPHPIYPDLENNGRKVNVPTSKGRYPITVNQRVPVKMAKLGRAVADVAVRLGPIGIAITLADALCTFSDICQKEDGSNTFEKVTQPLLQAGFPSSTPWAFYQVPGNYPKMPTVQAACSDYVNKVNIAAQPYGQSVTLTSYDFGTCYYNVQPNNVNGSQYVGFYSNECATGYNYNPSQSNCLSSDQPIRSPVTTADWDSVADNPSYATPTLVQPLIDLGEPVPMDVPTISPQTLSHPAGDTTETIRDSSGNPIGTRTTTTTLKVTPNSGTSINVTENTVTNETNITNNTSTTTTTETTIPAEEDQTEEEEEDESLTIDEVIPQDLNTYNVPTVFSWSSWGGGTCPPNPVLDAMGYPITLPVDTVCDGISMFKPIVLILAALTSAFIISGAIRQS